MAFVPSGAQYPAVRGGPVDDPRFLELFTPDAARANLLLAGVPFDDAVIGRKGAAGGPRAIREAFRFLATHDPYHEVNLAPMRIHDLGDVPVRGGDVLATHRAVLDHLVPHLDNPQRPIVVLGGDNSLSTPAIEAVSEAYGGLIGVVVLDAHYDLRPTPANGVPTSGTPYRRLINQGVILPKHLVEIGIRPFANTKMLADYAHEQGVHIVTRQRLAELGQADTLRHAMTKLAKVDHLFLSVDIDGLDQSIASGCSSPGAGGMTFAEAAHLVYGVARDRRCRAMDNLVEVAPELDPSGNTARTAAQLVAAFAGGVAARGVRRKGRARASK